SGSGTQIALGGIMVASTNDKNQFPVTPASSDITIERNRVLNSGRTGIWIGELAGGLIADNVIIGWDRHPELPLFGVNAATRAQLLQDFTQALVIRNSPDVVTRGNVTRADQDE